MSLRSRLRRTIFTATVCAWSLVLGNGVSASAEDRVNRHTKAPSFRVAACVGMGANPAVGEWYKGLQADPTHLVLGRVFVWRQFYVGTVTSGRKLTVGDDLETDGDLSLDWDIRVDDWFVFLGLAYPADTGRMAAFLEAGLGQMRHDFRVTITDGVQSLTERTRVDKLGLYGSGGLCVPIVGPLGLELALDLRLTGEEGPPQGRKKLRKFIHGAFMGPRLAVAAVF